MIVWYRTSRPTNEDQSFQLDCEPITLIKGDLYDIGDKVHEVTREALQEMMTKQQNVLGALRARL